MTNLDDLLSSLPQETQDVFKVARMEGEEAARKSVAVAREKGLPLAIRDGEDVYVNTKALSAIIQTTGLKAVFGQPTAEDFGRLIVALGDMTRAAEIYVDEA